MLKKLKLKAVYDSSEYDLVRDLIVPLLSNSIRYDRGVGFFTSGWLRIASAGLVEFASNGGKARVIMSPIISKDDLEAMKKGEEAKNNKILYKVLMNTVNDLGKSLKEDPLNTLAWLIADEIMEIRFAIPTGRLKGGDFHDKFAIFEDDNGHRVAIHGSYNDSIHGTLNGESFSVFKSWEDGQLEYLDNHDNRFHLIWNNKNKLFDIYSIPDAVKKKIIQYRTRSRPYRTPGFGQDKVLDLINVTTSQTLELRDYQRKAIKSWEDSNFSGIFSMATGTGKTLTSLACASNIYEEKNNLALVVVAPYLHLIEQWKKEMTKFGFMPILCSSSHRNWFSNLQSRIQDYNLGFREKVSCIITHSSAANKDFQNLLTQIKREPKMAIYDEVHHLGASTLSKALSKEMKYRIGLSATPERWFDIKGTERIMQYFSGVCFSFPLEEAIGKYLVPYRYFPHILELTYKEFDEYGELSKRIAKTINDEEDINENEYLQVLLRKRGRLINNAERKLETLYSLLRNKIDKAFSHVLFYSPVGEHKSILKTVANMGIKAREFVSDVEYKERKEILKQFAGGDIQALVAMKCLDEGVDVPSIKTAFILASTTNPKEFIQRRGRILRKFPGKKEAFIHDFIVVPPLSVANNNKKQETSKSILRREMPRFAEFSSSASNEFEARSSIRNVLEKFNALYMLDLKPWDLYEENKREDLDLYQED